MLTYQVRPRVLRLPDGKTFSFPSRGTVRFHFSPSQSFGNRATGGQTVLKGAKATMLFNANNGRHEVLSEPALKPLEVTLSAPNRQVTLQGSTLTVAQAFASISELSQLLEGVYFALPGLLSIKYAEPALIERVDGEVDDVQFRWELARWDGGFVVTTQEHQELGAANSWERLLLFTDDQNRRLLAALHFFYVATRLRRSAQLPGEFLAEVLLNLAKVLEVLFPKNAKEESLDAARRGLDGLGYKSETAERDFLPAIALRNHVDVGHVGLAIFNREQLSVLHGYTERAETCFRRLLNDVLERVESGRYSVAPYVTQPATGNAIKVIDRLRKAHAPNAA